MRIKYMGASDARALNKGEDFGGQLSAEAALDRDILWSWENNHTIDTDDYDGVNDEFWKLLLDYSTGPDGPKEFKDVSDLARVPTNEAQQIWRGMKKSEKSDDAADSSEADDGAGDGEGAVNVSGTAETSTTDPEDARGVSEATDTDESTSTVGGSTRPGPKGRARS